MQTKPGSIFEAAYKILSEGKSVLTPSQINSLKIKGVTPEQIKTLIKAIGEGYEFVSIIDSLKHKGSLLIRDYEDVNFSNIVYDKDLGKNDKCAIIDPSGKMTKISLEKFTELEG